MRAHVRSNGRRAARPTSRRNAEISTKSSDLGIDRCDQRHKSAGHSPSAWRPSPGRSRIGCAGSANRACGCS